MSNYVFIFATQHAERGVTDWLAEHDGNPNEVLQTRVSSTVQLTVVSYDIAASVDSKLSTFYKGSAVDHESGAVIFGLRGWLEYREAVDLQPKFNVEGQYLEVNWSGRLVRFKRDVFGMMPLLHTTGDGYVAVSDSMLALADLRRHMGDVSTPNEEVLLSRAVFSGLGGQQVSPDTIVEQIKFVPARQSLAVSIVGTPRPITAGSSLQGLGLKEGETYGEVIRTAASNIARLMATLARLNNWVSVMSLSGGYDSRVCLAGAVAAGVVGDLHYNTKNSLPVHAADYAVATQLADRFGFSLERPHLGDKLGAPREVDCTPFLLWALSDLGIYDYVTRVRSSRESFRQMGITGIGGEVQRGNYGWKTWAQAVGELNLEPLVHDALINQGRKGLLVVGADPDDKTASELHYMNYRHALHGGTHLPLHMLGFAPLLQSKLTALAYSEANEFPMPAYEQPGMVNDLTIVLSPEMASMPYDKPSKDLSAGFVEGRLRHLGGQINGDELTPYTIYGSPDDMPSGPPEFLLKLGKSRGLNLPQTRETMMELGAQGLDLLTSEPLRTVYHAVNENARWRFKKKGLSPVAAGETPGKLVAVRVLFGEC
ncbi:hypothetical protein [Paenarthrobacter sp. NPDC090522]|uniref:hypothetical protein n=1 Tax=Paenarthrobacter sp. NPDC090522 TaxID=3364383 RepID=UPI00382833AE